MKSIKAIILDMDGVVVDNHRYHFEAWMAFAKKYQFPLNDQIYRDKFNGKTNKDLFRMIFGDKSEEEFKKLADEKEGMYQKLYLPHMRELRGLSDFLDFVQRRRIKIGLGTSAPTSNVDFVLDHLRLRKYFDVIIDGEQVKKGKPDPEVYQTCCHRLDVKPHEAIVFEDSLAGLESGQRAGCQIVAVATSHPVSDLRVKTDAIISDFTEARSLIK